ncbi:unnamed protein product [Lota lota]
MRSVPLWVCVGLLYALGGAAAVPDGPPDAHQRWDTNELRSPPPATATAANGRGGGGGGGGSCPLRLRPSGQCSWSGDEDEEGCPYQLTLPPLTIQLPKQFRMLERTVKELQSLKETVGKLRSSCQECRGGGGAGGGVSSSSGTTGGIGEQQRQQQADQGRPSGAVRRDSGEVIKLKRMSASLRIARSQISALNGQLEGLNLLNMDNVNAMMDRKVENITGMVNKLSSTCTNQCAVQGSLQFILAPRDCSEYNVLEERKNGVYRVTPEARNGTFEVFCDMESYGSGWTVIQQRVNGSVSFNRTWLEYKKGFGNLRGEFWLGNDHIHLLTKAKDMVLRVELEDFEGVREYAKYDQFYVANEFLRYRLSVSGYSGTAGNALSFNKHFNHDQKFFTTPDRDNDMYPSGNCGAYYSSGWWFDACMSANLNGKYYHKRYKGVRNGIFWGTWHNISSEYYPTNYRQAFKTVKMMIRPKNYSP